MLVDKITIVNTMDVLKIKIEKKKNTVGHTFNLSAYIKLTYIPQLNYVIPHGQTAFGKSWILQRLWSPPIQTQVN